MDYLSPWRDGAYQAYVLIQYIAVWVWTASVTLPTPQELSGLSGG